MTSDAGAAIELRSVCKGFGISKDQRVLAADEVSLDIVPGAFVALSRQLQSSSRIRTLR